MTLDSALPLQRVRVPSHCGRFPDTPCSGAHCRVCPACGRSCSLPAKASACTAAAWGEAHGSREQQGPAQHPRGRLGENPDSQAALWGDSLDWLERVLAGDSQIDTDGIAPPPCSTQSSVLAELRGGGPRRWAARAGGHVAPGEGREDPPFPFMGGQDWTCCWGCSMSLGSCPSFSQNTGSKLPPAPSAIAS